VLYLRGLSTGDFKEALGALLGDRASGLSASSITRMTSALGGGVPVLPATGPERRGLCVRVADRGHFRVRLEDDRLCTLVLLGVRRDGTKELIAVETGRWAYPACGTGWPRRRTGSGRARRAGRASCGT